MKCLCEVVNSQGRHERVPGPLHGRIIEAPQTQGCRWWCSRYAAPVRISVRVRCPSIKPGQTGIVWRIKCCFAREPYQWHSHRYSCTPGRGKPDISWIERCSTLIGRGTSAWLYILAERMVCRHSFFCRGADCHSSGILLSVSYRSDDLLI